MLAWAAELRQAMERHAVPAELRAEVFVAAINNVRLIGLPFEPYSGIGLAIKRNLRPGHTLVAGYSNGLYGYCPTRQAKDAGGYGPDSAYRWFGGALTAVGYGADEILAAEATRLAQSLR